MIELETEILYRQALQRGAARRAVRRAIAAGRLQPEPCRECGAPKAEAHHAFGYAPKNRLRVEWYCRLHHARRHRESDGGYYVDDGDISAAIGRQGRPAL